MKRQIFIILFIALFTAVAFADPSISFNFRGIWGDEAFEFEEVCSEFLSISHLTEDTFLVIWSGINNNREWFHIALGTLKSPNKLVVRFNNLEWTIEGIADFENGKLVYEGLVMYVEPDDEGVIGFDRVETIDPKYLVPRAER